MDTIVQAVRLRKPEWVAFCQKLIQTPSPTYGFSPCEEQLAHTVFDSVSIELMAESLCCYPRLLTEFKKA